MHAAAGRRVSSAWRFCGGSLIWTCLSDQKCVFWLKPFIENGLAERGWEVPVLEGYSASITLAKLMIDLSVNASGVTYMSDNPKRLPEKLLL